MKKYLFCFSLVAAMLATTSFAEDLKVVYHKPYADRYGSGPTGSYTWRICGTVPAICNASFTVRSSSPIYSGDYFWPAFAGLPPAILSYPNYSVEKPTSEEKDQIERFLNYYFPKKFQNPTLIDSAQVCFYDCYAGNRREFYVMLSEGDTIYVISGWFGKFMSLFRATPYDKRWTPTNFINQAIQIAPKLKRLSISDQIVQVDSGKLGEENLYFMQAYEISDRIWLRHYPINIVLPPEDPKTGKERQYNLIEISKIYDQELFDGRLNWLLYGR